MCALGPPNNSTSGQVPLHFGVGVQGAGNITASVFIKSPEEMGGVWQMTTPTTAGVSAVVEFQQGVASFTLDNAVTLGNAPRTLRCSYTTGPSPQTGLLQVRHHTFGLVSLSSK